MRRDRSQLSPIWLVFIIIRVYLAPVLVDQQGCYSEKPIVTIVNYLPLPCDFQCSSRR